MTARPWLLTSKEIRTALDLPGSAEPGHEYHGVSTDSRTLEPGDVFIALDGARSQGADFLSEAVRAGATGAIVSTGREDPTLPLEYFSVADPLEALGRLATCARERTDARVIAITGSSGKTTVKEMIALALSEERRVYKTEGNLNSRVGLPLTILRAPLESDVWVLEVGASEPGEIRALAEIAQPDDAVVTTTGPAHLEAFVDESCVLHEKLELARCASPSGHLIVGELPGELPAAAREIRPDVIVAGLGEMATYRPDRVETRAERVGFERDGVWVGVPVGGEHHLRDALIATAVATRLGVSLETAAHGLARYAPLGHRGAIRRVGGLTVLADCYNANPESFRAAIAHCRDLFPGRRLAAFVGSMLELGAHEADAHREVAEDLLGSGFALVAATGAFAAVDFDPLATHGVRVFQADAPAEVWEAFAGELHGDEVILVKASHGARLEGVLDRLESRFGGRS